MDFIGLAIGVSRGDSLAEGIQAAHLRFDPTSSMIARSALPENPAIVSGGAQGLVSGACRRAILFPRAPVLSDPDDRDCVAVDAS